MKPSKSQSTKTSNLTTKESTMKTKSRTQSSITESTSTELPDLVTPPPVGLVIPQPPAGWSNAASGAQYRGVKPNQLELTTLADAVGELMKFTDYAETLGKTVPPYEEALSLFDAASKWSTMRSAAAIWDNYCAVQEGVVWTHLRDQLTRIKPAFTLALRGDPSMAVKYTKLTSLFEARTSIGRKAAVTRKLNKVAVAAGKAPTHGAIGKKRKRADEKALALKGAQFEAAAAASSNAVVTSQSAPVASAPVAPAPQPVAAPAATVQPAVNAAPLNGTSILNGSNGAATNGTNGSNGSNGAAHA